MIAFFLIQIENHLLNKNNLFHVSRLFFYFFIFAIKNVLLLSFLFLIITIFLSSSNSFNIRMIDIRIGFKKFTLRKSMRLRTSISIHPHNFYER